MFILSMDMARLLWTKMFDGERVEELVDELKSSPCCVRRHKALYLRVLGLSNEQLHTKVRGQWTGRMAQKMTEALSLWCQTYVKPVLDSEPGFSIPRGQVDNLLSYLTNNGSVSKQEVELVNAIVCGQVARHPMIQGVLAACMNRLTNEERGTSTMKNRFRTLSTRNFVVGNGLLLLLLLGQ